MIMENITFSILLGLIGIILGVGVTFLITKLKGAAAKNEADKLIENAKREAEKIKSDNVLELKEESYKLKKQTDEEIREKKKELNELNDRIDNRERSLDKRDELINEREKSLDQKDKNLLAKQKELDEKDAKMEKLLKEQIELLEKISGFSKEKARTLVMEKVENAISYEDIKNILKIKPLSTQYSKIKKILKEGSEAERKNVAMAAIELKIKDYLLVKSLGKGTFGEVFLTKKGKSSKLYATKKIPSSKLLNKDFKKYLENEINIMSVSEDKIHPHSSH